MAIFNSYVKLPEGNGVQEMFTDLPFFTWPQQCFQSQAGETLQMEQ